jgi:competence protein ComEC
LRDADLIYHSGQQKLIVYNIPKNSAVDIVAGNHYCFAGDLIVLQDAFLRNFNLKSSRIKNRIYASEDLLLPGIENCILQIQSSKVLMLGQNSFRYNATSKIKVDALILTSKVNLTSAEINDLFNCKYIIADSSVPLWKSSQWKKEFEQLHLRFYSVAQDGAFTLKL